MKFPMLKIRCSNYHSRILILCLLLSPVISDTSGQDIHFDHYAVEDGLSQSVILSIYQDSEGYIWFGTQSGLSQFNGYEFVNYSTMPSRNSISNSWVYAITEDQEGNIYLGTKGGINKFEKKTGNFSVIPHKDSGDIVTDNFIYGLTSDENKLYVNTPPALTIIDLKTGEKERYFNDFEYDGALRDLGLPTLKSKNKKIWMGSHNGLYSFDLITKKFNNYPFDRINQKNRINNHITALYEERNGNILIGTEGGLYVFDVKTRDIFPITGINEKLSNPFIRDIVRDKNNVLWIATEGGGLNRIETGNSYNPDKIDYFLSDRDFISHDILYSLFIDNSDNLWVGSIAGIDKTNLKKTGIGIYANTSNSDSYNLLDNVIASVYRDNKGRLWIGNWGKGLNIINAESKRTIHYKSEFEGKYHIPENHVHVIFEDSKNRVWIGTRNGVSLFNKAEERFIPAHKFFEINAFDCFQNIRIYTMMEDHEGRIWVGTGNGIFILDLQSEKLISLRSNDNSTPSISSNLVYALLKDRDNEIWIATSEGLNRYNPEDKTIRVYRNNPEDQSSLINNFTISLFEDYLGNIWIGTGTGMSRYSKNDSSFINFTLQDGLPSNIIYDIIEDNNNKLWLSTGRGLAYIEPGKANKKEFHVIDHLRGQEFNIKAVYKSEDGKLFFGGMNGLVSFYPDSLKKNQFIPPVRITNIEKESDGERQSLNTYQDEIILSYKDYSFTIEFTALDFTDPGKNRYAFRMKGFSDKWIDLGTRRFVHFTNLPHGSYTFEVKGSNNDGIWNPEATSLQIVINPPWWLSDYAIAGYIIFAVIIIILIIYLRERKLKREKRILEEKVRIRTSEIARQKELVEESEQKLSSTINSLDDLVFVLDENGILQEFYNPRKRKTHLIFPDLRVGNHYRKINFPEEVNKQIGDAFITLDEKDAIMEFDHHFSDDGMVYWYNTKISPKRNPEGELTGLVIVARDITDRKESEEKLAHQKEELNELNVMKDKFFSILAHDLKNPFANLYSMGDLIVKNYKHLEEEEKLEALKKMHKSAEFIYSLLENLLTWSRTQRGKIEYQPVVFDLSKLIDINLNLHKIPAEKKGIRLIDSTAENLTAFGDREMINTVIRNLLGNAVKYSSDGDTIETKAIKKDGFFEVSVKDSGAGMSYEDQNKLFKLEVKYQSRGTAGETGTGLGLVLCKEFVEKNGGKIWCESEPGKGTSFYFTIPSENK